MSIVRAAVVQAGSIIFDREATIAKAVALTAQAADQGAQVVATSTAYT